MITDFFEHDQIYYAHITPKCLDYHKLSLCHYIMFAKLPDCLMFFGASTHLHQARSSHHEGRLAQSQLHAAPQEVTSKMRRLEQQSTNWH